MRVNKEEKEHLLKVLNYMWANERKHYEESDKEGRREHIFKSLKLLKRKCLIDNRGV
jgi:hypothetical protein